MSKLSIVIVNYNVKFYLEQCINSLVQSIKHIDAQIYVFDNHSQDGSIEYLKKLYPDVCYIESNHNLGFAKANNIAIRQSESEYVLLLNPDTIVGSEVIDQCLSFMDTHSNSGALGVKMLRCDGFPANESRRGLPTPMTSFYKMCGLCAKFPQNKRFGHYYMSYLPWNEATKIEVVSGAFCMLRRKALEDVGLLDEDFFMYGEDIDLSFRVLKGGYSNWYLPVNILHYKGESTQKSSFKYVHVFYEAMLIFFHKHYNHLNIFVSLPIKIAIYIKASMALTKMMTEKIRKGLGFKYNAPHDDQEYLFWGGVSSFNKCNQILQRNGIESNMQMFNKSDVDGIKLAISRSTQNLINLIFDTNCFTYTEMLELLESHANAKLSIVTYNAQRNIVITATDVYL